TVLFVSHNMQAVSTLTKRTLVLDRGACVFDGATSDGIAHYRAMQSAHATVAAAYAAPPGSTGNRVFTARVVTSEPGGVHRWGLPIRFEFEFEIPEPSSTIRFSFQVIDADERRFFHLWGVHRDLRSLRARRSSFCR